MSRTLLFVAISTGCSGFLPFAAAQDAPQVAPGEAVALSGPDPYRGSRSWDAPLHRRTRADVLATGNRSGTLNWQPASGRDLRLRLRLVIGATQPPGPLIAARVALQWPDGKHESLDIRVVVIPRAAVAAKGSKDFLVALTPVTRAASPGGSAKLRYTVVSNEETDERVRLRVEAGSGWRLLDLEVLQQELLLEAWDKIEGEFDVVVSEEAQIGERQLVRLFVAVAGEPGEMEARGYVSVVKRGRIKPACRPRRSPPRSGCRTLGPTSPNRGGPMPLRYPRSFPEAPASPLCTIRGSKRP